MKYSEIKRLSKEERDKKLKELKMELLKSQTKSTKSGNTNKGKIKKIIARILTFNNAENKSKELNK